jgi:hypothetical protein
MIQLAGAPQHFHASIAASIAMHKAAIYGKAFARHQAGVTALLHDSLEQDPVHLAFTKAAIAVLGES